MRKVLIIIFLVNMLTCSFISCTKANSIYVGSSVGANWNSESDGYSNRDDDLSGVETNIDLSLGEFLDLGVAYMDETKKDSFNGDISFDTFRIDGGLNLLSSVDSHIALTVGFNQIRFDDGKNSRVTGTMIGIESLDCFADNGRIEAACSWSISGTSKSDDSSVFDVSIFLSNLKYSLLLTDNLAVTIGYRFDQYCYDNADNNKVTLAGPIAGLTYIF